jgi:photosystem II stability/assembly factor-like uncharacterized protein
MRRLALAMWLAVLLVVPASSSAAVTAGGTGWVWANPLPQGGDLDAIAFSGARGIAAGAGGLILRTDDAGATWSAVASGTETDLTEVAIPDANTVYVGGGCVLRRSTDGGATFTRVRFAVRESKCSSGLAQLAFPTPLLGYLVLSDGKVLRTTNGGRSFARRATLNVGSSVPQGGATGAFFGDANTGVISTGLESPVFLHTVDGGQTWTPVAPSGVVSRVTGMDFVTPSLGYAVSDSALGSMAKTEDGGLTWTPLPLTGATGSERAIDCADANACVILAGTAPDGAGDRLTWTADGGLTGTTITPSSPLEALVFSSATRVVGVGDGGATLASDDAGHTFARVGGVLPGDLVALRRSGANTVFAFATDGTLARSTDRGLSWQPIGSAPLGGLLDLSFVSDTVGYILAKGGALQRTDDSGTSWSVVGDEVAGARALLATGVDTLLVGSTAGILRSTDGGATFARAAGAGKSVLGFDRAGKTLVAYGPRALLVSTDGGARWRAAAPPPGGRIGSVDFLTAKGGYVVRADGEVLSTSNGGRSWRLVASAGRDDVVGVSFGDPRHGYLVLGSEADLGGVLRTTDGGRSWRPQVLGRQSLAQVVALGKNGGVALSDGGSQVFATATGGDAGRRSRLTLRVLSKRRKAGRTIVTVGGRLKPALAGAGVSVTARIGGSWIRKFAAVDASGRFRTTWKLRRGTVFVAQWRGSAGVQGDGTVPLAVGLGGHRHR